ncbi:MAG: hypothetical protein PSN44_08550 [Gammaproteobacteria bacterium]|nr:hypothetical protein [Gammaproteobacteria bacterium]
MQNNITEYNDEIDLREVLLPLWKSKYLILIISVIFSGLVLAYHLSKYSFNIPQQYRATINFNFEGVEKGLYPNGTRFSPNDLLSGNILRRVFDELVLDEAGISFIGFEQSLSVRSGFLGDVLFEQTAADIAGKDKKITVEAYNTLVSSYTDTLRQQSLKSGILSFDNENLDLSKDKVEMILLKIPEAWAKYSIKELGVMNAYGDYVNLSPLASQDDEPVVMTYKLSDYEKLLSSSVKALQQEQKAKSIIDPKTGLSLSDIEYKLQQIDKYKINTLKSIIMINPVFSSSGIYNSFRSSQLESLKRKADELERLVLVYIDVLKEFDQSSMSIQSSKLETVADASSSTSIYSPQYGDSLVDSLLELGAKMSDPEYRKVLLQDKIKLSKELQTIKTEIQLFESSSSSSESISKDKFIESITSTAEELEELKSALHNIVLSLNSFLYNNTGSLYFLNGEIVSVDYSFSDSKLKLKVIIGFILGGMLSVFGVWGRRLLTTKTDY